MAQEQRHVDTVERLDLLLRDGESPFAQVALDVAETSYRGWYARLLSSLALITTSEDIVFAQATREQHAKAAQVVVFTSQLVIVARVDDVADQSFNPSVLAAPRRSLRSLRLTASERIDVKGSSKRGWPGEISFVAEYESIEHPIEIRGAGVDPYSISNQPPIRKLLDSLSRDLIGSDSL